MYKDNLKFNELETFFVTPVARAAPLSQEADQKSSTQRKSVCIRHFSGLHLPAFILNTKIYFLSLHVLS